LVWVRDVLASHQLAWELLQGQIFLVLGFAIIFLTRGGVRLELARELGALAAFGFCQAAATWSGAWVGYATFAPVWVPWFRLVVLAAGYAFLLTFALELAFSLENGTRERWLIAAGLVLLWGCGLLLSYLVGVPVARLGIVGEVSARYGLALPGGLLGAWGLRRETYRTIGPGRFLPLVKPPMRITEVALGFFAVFAGAIVPAAGFFPARFLNEAAVFAQTGVPISVFRGLAGIGMTYGVARALGVVLDEIEIWLEGVEQMQALVAERERISRELHDGIIQSIYASGLILEGARQNMVSGPTEAREQVTIAIENLNRTIQDIRRYIFDLRGEATADDLETGLRKILRDFEVNTLLDTVLSVDGDERPRLDAERRQHIFQIAREALTNVARHARAREVRVDLVYSPKELLLSISDDGVGLSSTPHESGHGLRNMRERARLLNGRLEIDTGTDRGLTLSLIVPYRQLVIWSSEGSVG